MWVMEFLPEYLWYPDSPESTISRHFYGQSVLERLHLTPGVVSCGSFCTFIQFINTRFFQSSKNKNFIHRTVKLMQCNLSRARISVSSAMSWSRDLPTYSLAPYTKTTISLYRNYLFWYISHMSETGWLTSLKLPCCLVKSAVRPERSRSQPVIFTRALGSRLLSQAKEHWWHWSHLCLHWEEEKKKRLAGPSEG